MGDKKTHSLFKNEGESYLSPIVHPMDVRLFMDDFGFDWKLRNHGGKVNIFSANLWKRNLCAHFCPRLALVGGESAGGIE